MSGPIDADLTPRIRESIDQLVVIGSANQIGDRRTAADALAKLQASVAGLALSIARPRPGIRSRRPTSARLGHAREGRRP